RHCKRISVYHRDRADLSCRRAEAARAIAPGCLRTPSRRRSRNEWCERDAPGLEIGAHGSRRDAVGDLKEPWVLSNSQGETPNSFSISAIIGWVKPALRNSAKSSAMARSHSLPSCPEVGLPL